MARRCLLSLSLLALHPSIPALQLMALAQLFAPCATQAYKQMVKLHFKLKRFSDMMSAYKEMLTYIK